MPRELAMVVPAAGGEVTGGNLYNAGLVTGLGARGSVRVVEVGDWPADAATAGPTLYLADSLCLAEIARFVPPRERDHRVWVLAHLLPGLDPGERDEARLELEARVLSSVDGAVATSDFVAAWLAARGLAGRVAVVPPAAPRLQRRAAPPSDGSPVLLVVANLVPCKAVAELVAELAAVIAPDDALRLRVVGRSDLDPGYAAACATAIADPRLAGRAELVGPCRPAALERHLHAAALLVSAARIETYGMALAEGRAAGVPLVVRDAGNAAAHVEDGVTGVVCRSLRDVAATCLRLVRDPVARARLDAGARAAPPAGTATWADAAESLLEQLAAIFPPGVASRRAGPP